MYWKCDYWYFVVALSWKSIPFHTSLLLQIELASNSTSKVLTELFPGRDYNVSLQAVNSAGSSSADYFYFRLPVVGMYSTTTLYQVLMFQ